jgi:ABC-type long-subunit fatty acid transport system fused permease/ATPase subunit
MFREFFCSRSCFTLGVAWFGLVGVVGYSVFLAWVKREINEWYNTFYDLMASAGTAALLEGTNNATDEVYASPAEVGSGLFFPAAPPSSPGAPTLADYRVRVGDELRAFAWIVAPLVCVSPAAKWVRSAWAFSWRMALMRGYLRAWDEKREPIEGASQRLHEDSQRFASALMGCLVTVLDACFTLIVFTPVLLDLSERIAPPMDMGFLRGMWLWILAAGAAVGGLGGAVIFGKHLVGLEVQNQLVEALLRKDLVLLETTPAVIVGQTIEQQQYAPWRFFEETLRRLYRNYHALFRHFSLLNTWLSFYDQVMTLLPYFVAAPLLFAADPERRITLGTLIQMSNSFEKVFSSLSVVAENWGAVNEFRSVLVRLREFERKLYHGGAPPPPPDGDAATGPAGGRARNVVRRLRPTPRALVSMRDVEAVGPSREATPSEAGSNTELVVVHGAPWERDEDENELPDAHTLSDDEARV